MVDIHHYDEQYATGEQHVHDATISQRNKDLILGYRDACLLHGVCGKVRLVRVFDVLVRCAKLLGKDYDTITRQDMEGLITYLLRNGRKPATISTYKAIVKRFLGWVCCPDQFPRITVQPPVVAWMTVHLKKRDEKRLQRTELLTPQDIDALLQVCHNPRDKALMSILWETGGRISEIGNLELRHVTKHEHGYILDVEGKTGRRSPLIISSAPQLAVWLSHHPFRDRPSAPLWVHYQYRKDCTPIDYDTIRTMLKRHFRRAGITKPFHPHLFRHSRATFVLARGIMTDAQARRYFGWTSESTMIGRYAHLVDADAHNALLKENNLAPSTPTTTALATHQCQRCGTLNAPQAPHCMNCTLPLHERAMYSSPDSGAQQLVLQFATLLVDRGLIDEAARVIHHARLGDAVEQLLVEEEKKNG
jgi:integrase/recombinase XerD